MTRPNQETFQERALHLALDLQGILLLAQRVQGDVHQIVEEVTAVERGEGMEENLVGESSLGNSSSEESKEEGDQETFEEAQEDFFT